MVHRPAPRKRSLRRIILPKWFEDPHALWIFCYYGAVIVVVEVVGGLELVLFFLFFLGLFALERVGDEGYGVEVFL